MIRAESLARTLGRRTSRWRASKLRADYDHGDASADDILAEAAKYRFYHNVNIAPGVRTQGLQWADGYVDAVARVIAGLPIKGKRVLDIGCRDGAHMFHAESLGASEVIGIDNDLSQGLTDFLLPFKRSKARAYELNLYDLSPGRFGTFDIVIFAGVLYHLRYPVWGLRRILDVLNPRGILLIESAFVEAFADLPILCCPVGSDSPFEPTSVTFFNEAGLRDTLLSIGYSKIKRHKTFLRTFTREEELGFISERFPAYVEQFGEKAPLGFCRKIFTCQKLWDKKEPRLLSLRGSGAKHEKMARTYWDGLHTESRDGKKRAK